MKTKAVTLMLLLACLPASAHVQGISGKYSSKLGGDPCVPEPSVVIMGSIGVLFLLRRKKMNLLIAIYILFHQPNSSKDVIYSVKDSIVELYSSKEMLDGVVLDHPDVLDKLVEFPVILPIRSSYIPINPKSITEVNP